MLGEQAAALAASPTAVLPFIPYHPEELRRRGHKGRGLKQPRCARPLVDAVHSHPLSRTADRYDPSSAGCLGNCC